MTFNTGNPIGSTDARDLSDNSENLDFAVNSLLPTFVDRLGVTRDTLEGVYQKSAYYRAGTFDTGYTLTNNRQTLAYGNIEYSWAGAFPKVVTAGSTPATSGGVGAGAWVDRTDDSLRDEIRETVFQNMNRLAAESGYTLVGGSFEEGGTLTNTNDVLWYQSNGMYYSWAGAFPKVVAAGATPATSGGIGAGAWVDRTDVTLRLELSESTGSSLIGHNAETVGQALDRQEAEISQAEAATLSVATRVRSLEMDSGVTLARSNQVAAAFVNGLKGAVILGDSISAGAFAGDLYSNGWTRLLARAVNGELGSASYGFTPMLTLGSGQPYQSIDIHSVAFVNAGAGWVAQDGANGSGYPNGFAFRSTSIGNKITFTLPSFMRRALVHYAKRVGGGTFTVSVNGTLAKTVSTADTADNFATAEIATPDNQYGSVTVVIETTTAAPVDICGISYLSGVLEPCVQNFSTSGRRAHDLGSAAITTICANAGTVIFALGHNDFGETGATYISETVQVIDNMIASANANGVKVVVTDFCWSAASDNWMRAQLRRLAEETNGVYVDFPTLFEKDDGSPADSSWLINSLRMFIDGSHPNTKGNEFIFEVIAKALKLSCTSKAQSLTLHDYWLSLPLQASALVENSLTDLPSAVKRTPAGVSIRLYVEAAASGAFPAGTYALTTAYPSRSGISSIQGQLTAIMRADGAAVIGGLTTNASGAILLTVFAGGAVYNDISLSYIAS